MNLYRVVVTTQSSDCISALSTSSGWKRTGDNTFETVREGYQEGVAMLRAWSSFHYPGKVRFYSEASNTVDIHAELLEKIRKPRRPSKVPPVHHPAPHAEAAGGALAGRENRTMQVIQTSVPELRINRELCIRLQHEYEEKFKQWQKEREVMKRNVDGEASDRPASI